MTSSPRSPSPRAISVRRAASSAIALALALCLTATSCSGSAESETTDGPAALNTPIFSAPTNITNPLFAVLLDQAIQLGAEGDVALRHEITLLDRTRVIRWAGNDIEAIVSQFVAYGDGAILEVATDYFAQADDGSVWYLGEDVANYEDGKIANHDGTWLAGRDGPAGMIMPAQPQVGDVYRPENIPGLVFEEVTVTAVGLVVDGPMGPVPGAIQVQERLLDGTLEDKVFAPGYGEFQANVPADDELVTIAVAVPIDGPAGPTGDALEQLAVSTRSLFEDSRTPSWPRLASAADQVHRSWEAASAGDLPPLLSTQISAALEALDGAVADQDQTALRQAAIGLELATLDAQLPYEGLVEVDEHRLEVWNLQRQLHQATGDSAGIASDLAIIAAIQDRLPD